MNKIYGIIAIFAFAGLLLPTSVMQVEAVSSDLQYMLTIAKNAQNYIKTKIDEMENSNIQDWKDRRSVLEIYKESESELDKLSESVENGDVKSSREHFLLTMGKIKQISQMLNQIAENKSQREIATDYSLVIKRYEMNIQKQQQFSDKLNAGIDFSELRNLISLAKLNLTNGQTDKVEQTLDRIAILGTDIQKTLLTINEENKMIRAQILVQKYIDRINALIVQAKTSDLTEHVETLENTKTHLIQANSTSQIAKNIRIVITIHNDIKESNKNNLQKIGVDDIRLSQTQRISSELNQLETKAKLLHSDSQGHNKALYYVEKALATIDNVRNNLDAPESKIDAKIKQIERLLDAAEKIVQEST